MKEQAELELVGRVESALGQYRFLVRFDNGHSAVCHVCGRLIIHKVFVTPGDTVTAVLSGYDLSRGRITRRH